MKSVWEMPAKKCPAKMNAEFVTNAIKTLELNVPTFQTLLSPGGTPQTLIEQLTTYPETTVYINKTH